MVSLYSQYIGVCTDKDLDPEKIYILFSVNNNNLNFGIENWTCSQHKSQATDTKYQTYRPY